MMAAALAAALICAPAAAELPAPELIGAFPADQEQVEAPLDAGFLRVRQGETDLLAASVHFADTREADFAACAPADTLDEGNAVAVERHTEEDHWWRAWVLLLLLALLISWHFTREREAAKVQSPVIPPKEVTP